MIEVAKKIEQKIEVLQDMRGQLNALAKDKATKTSTYERWIAKTLIKMRNGHKIEFEGEEILNPPTSIMDKLAKGVCWKFKLQMDEAEAMYKMHVAQMDSIKSELNGLQSINRHLD